ncbi:MAG: TolC family protein [Methylophilaceae bacterium]
MNIDNPLYMRRFGARTIAIPEVRLFKWYSLALFLLFGMMALNAQAATYTLPDVISAAMQQNPVIGLTRAQEDAAQAGLTTAKAYLNPEIEAGSGPARYRSGGQGDGKNWGVTLSQPLEFFDVRRARREIAESNIQVTGVGSELTRIELRARVKSAFYDVLQRQAVLKLVEGDRNLLQQIRERVKLRVDVGESPRYELIKADTEALAAERDYQAAIVRITEAKGYLRGLIGQSMPMDFDVQGELPLGNTLPSLDSLRQQIDQSPLLTQARAAREAAQARLRLEQSLRFPGVTLKAGIEQDPDLTSMRFGLAVPLPLWSQRQGQIAEAAAGVRQVDAILSDRELGLQRDIDSAYQRYLIASHQVASFENGLLKQSESTLKVAEDAYRFGERGILEYLDAQRTFSAVRKDYLAARYDYVSTMLEIERLLGTELLEVKP